MYGKGRELEIGNATSAILISLFAGPRRQTGPIEYRGARSFNQSRGQTRTTRLYGSRQGGDRHHSR